MDCGERCRNGPTLGIALSLRRRMNGGVTWVLRAGAVGLVGSLSVSRSPVVLFAYRRSDAVIWLWDGRPSAGLGAYPSDTASSSGR